MRAEKLVDVIDRTARLSALRALPERGEALRRISRLPRPALDDRKHIPRLRNLPAQQCVEDIEGDQRLLPDLFPYALERERRRCRARRGHGRSILHPAARINTIAARQQKLMDKAMSVIQHTLIGDALPQAAEAEVFALAPEKLPLSVAQQPAAAQRFDLDCLRNGFAQAEAKLLALGPQGGDQALEEGPHVQLFSLRRTAQHGIHRLKSDEIVGPAAPLLSLLVQMFGQDCFRVHTALVHAVHVIERDVVLAANRAKGLVGILLVADTLRQDNQFRPRCGELVPPQKRQAEDPIPLDGFLAHQAEETEALSPACRDLPRVVARAMQHDPPPPKGFKGLPEAGDDIVKLRHAAPPCLCAPA